MSVSKNSVKLTNSTVVRDSVRDVLKSNEKAISSALMDLTSDAVGIKFEIKDDHTFWYNSKFERGYIKLPYSFDFVLNTWRINLDMNMILQLAHEKSISMAHLKIIMDFLCGKDLVVEDFESIVDLPKKMTDWFGSVRLTLFLVIELSRCCSLTAMLQLYNSWKNFGGGVKNVFEIMMANAFEENRMSDSPAKEFDLLPQAIIRLINIECINIWKSSVSMPMGSRLGERNVLLLTIFENLQDQKTDDCSNFWLDFIRKLSGVLFEKSSPTTAIVFFRLLMQEQKDGIRVAPTCTLRINGQEEIFLSLHLQILGAYSSIKSFSNSPITCTFTDMELFVKYFYNQLLPEYIIPKMTTACFEIIKELGLQNSIENDFLNPRCFKILKSTMCHYKIMRIFIQLRLKVELMSFVANIPNDFLVYQLRRDLEECSVADLEWVFSLGIPIDTKNSYFILLHWAFWQAKVYGFNVEEPPKLAKVATKFKQVVKLLPKTIDDCVINELCKYHYVHCSELACFTG